MTVGMINLTPSEASSTPDPSSGGVFNFGSAPQYGWTGVNRLGASPVVAMASTRNGDGYWEVNARGDVFSFGNAGFSGSMKQGQASSPIVAMAADPAGGGYWLVTRSGGVYSFGAAGFHGSLGGKRINSPVVGIAATPNGRGYWLASSDGGVFSFGDAKFKGSLVGHRLNTPIAGIAATPNGGGYWLAARGGGVFSLGDAHFFGSASSIRPPSPIVGITASPRDGGYWLVSRSGGIYTYGRAPYLGSAGNTTLATPVVGMSVRAGGTGYWLVTSTTSPFTCPAGGVTLSLQGTVQTGASGHAGQARGQVWALTNTSSSTCNLGGYPSVRVVAGGGGTYVAASPVRGSGRFYQANRAGDVAVLPGQSAQFWTEESGTKSTGCVDGAEMVVGAPTTGSVSPMNGLACPGSFKVSAIGRLVTLR